MKRPALCILGLACLLGLTWACYGRALARNEQFAYRDAAHFYYPLYLRVQQEWDARRWPLWEPEENGGMPLMGNPTAAVLYPGKLLYTLAPYPVAARLYVVAHTLLAFGAMLALMRSWKTSWVGSTLAALSYAFSGPILFQYCNIIYLVGASWFPLGIRAVDLWLRLGRRLALVELAAVLAMETLGGDPEMAYLTGLCAGGYALMLARNRERADDDSRPPWTRLYFLIPLALGCLLIWVVGTLVLASYAPGLREVRKPRQPTSPLPWTWYAQPALALAWGAVGAWTFYVWRRERRRRPPDRNVAIRVLVPMLAGLAGSAVLAAALAAAQLFPVFEFTSQTGRSVVEGPHEIHTFSLEPLRIPEFLWPNVFGTSFDGNRSWLLSTQLTSKAMKVWVPTLYLGAFMLMLAFAGMRWRWSGERPWRGWLTIIAFVSLFAAFGEFTGPVYWARFSERLQPLIGIHDDDHTSPIRADKFLRDGDGSFYSTLAAVLPGFRQFRFPSKLLTLTMMALAALAGGAWDEVVSDTGRTRRRVLWWTIACLILTAAALAFLGWNRTNLTARLGRSQGSSSFGSFDEVGAFLELRASLIHTLLVLLAGLTAVVLARKRPVLTASLGLFALTCDLGFANARYVFSVPQALMDEKPEVLSYIEKAEREKPGAGPYRVHRMPLWAPLIWREEASKDRVGDFVRWERRTLQPKYGITEGVHYTQTLGVAELFDFEWFFGGFRRDVDPSMAEFLGIAPEENPKERAQVVVYPRRAYDIWTTRYFVLPFYPNKWNDDARAYGTMLENTEVVFPTPGTFSEAPGTQKARDWVRTADFQVRKNLAAYPRAWVVHQARFIKMVRDADRESRNEPMTEILYSAERLWREEGRPVYDPRQIVWIDEDHRAEVNGRMSGAAPTTNELVAITRHEPDRVEMEVTMDSPGMVVLADIYYPGWNLTIDGAPAPIHRANRMMRGAIVPTGKHRLAYVYDPSSFRIGLWTSALGLVALAAATVFFMLRPGGNETSPPDA